MPELFPELPELFPELPGLPPELLPELPALLPVVSVACAPGLTQPFVGSMSTVVVKSGCPPSSGDPLPSVLPLLLLLLPFPGFSSPELLSPSPSLLFPPEVGGVVVVGSSVGLGSLSSSDVVAVIVSGVVSVSVAFHSSVAVVV